jgi:hypothetical protein
MQVARKELASTYGPEALEDVQVDIVLRDLFEDGRESICRCQVGRAQTRDGRVPERVASV